MSRRKKSSSIEKEDIFNLDYNPKLLPNFILERGFSKKVLKEWECGYDKRTGGMIIPVYNENNMLIGSICRHPEGIHPKYMYSKGFQRNDILFGLNKIITNKNSIDFVIVVEGPLDVIWLYQHGYPAVSLLGAQLSLNQSTLFADIKTAELVLCFDNDSAGNRINNTVKNNLGDLFFVTRIDIPNQYKDIQDVRDKILLNDIIDNRRRILGVEV